MRFLEDYLRAELTLFASLSPSKENKDQNLAQSGFFLLT